jgi:hypothetical protein
MCDAEDKCAAASFTESECNLHRFGFAKKADEDEWSSYVKAEVGLDMDRMDKLEETFPLIQLRQRLTNFYNSSDALTPFVCFTKCNQSEECTAASFTVDIQLSDNCYFFRGGEFGVTSDLDGIEMWTSFIKSSGELALAPSLNVRNFAIFTKFR